MQLIFDSEHSINVNTKMEIDDTVNSESLSGKTLSNGFTEEVNEKLDKTSTENEKAICNIDNEKISLETSELSNGNDLKKTIENERHNDDTSVSDEQVITSTETVSENGNNTTEILSKECNESPILNQQTENHNEVQSITDVSKEDIVPDCTIDAELKLEEMKKDKEFEQDKNSINDRVFPPDKEDKIVVTNVDKAIESTLNKQLIDDGENELKDISKERETDENNCQSEKNNSEAVNVENNHEEISTSESELPQPETQDVVMPDAIPKSDTQEDIDESKLLNERDPTELENIKDQIDSSIELETNDKPCDNNPEELSVKEQTTESNMETSDVDKPCPLLENKILNNEEVTTKSKNVEDIHGEDNGKDIPISEKNNEDCKDDITNTKEIIESLDDIQNTQSKAVVKEDEDSTLTMEIKDSDEESSFNKLENDKSTLSSSRIKLSNSMNILSDDDEEDDKKQTPAISPPPTSSNDKCINLVDDDDCMLIDEDTEADQPKAVEKKDDEVPKFVNEETKDESVEAKPTEEMEQADQTNAKDDADTEPSIEEQESVPESTEKAPEDEVQKKKSDTPLIPKQFLQNCKRKLSDMSREDLEEFCVMKIAEAITDRTSLNEIKTKLKAITLNVEEHRKKAVMLTKQNRDLQVVLKSVQEEQKKKTNGAITPLKITRSVGMQVVMVDKPVRRKPSISGPSQPSTVPVSSPSKVIRHTNANQRNSTGNAIPNSPIPVPRLVPAQSSAKVNVVVNPKPTASNVPNGAKKSPAVQQKAEKRPLNRQNSNPQSVTVDLTDDEPPAKINRPSPVPPVRLVNQQSLMAPRIPSPAVANSPRKVYIPISSSQADGLRVGQRIMLRGVRPPDPVAVTPAVRSPAAPRMMRLPTNPVRMRTNFNMRHPAPLPDSVKQYQPPNWKNLPPAPDLKLSKVENGIVVSWKIDGYLEGKFEEIASYQVYAYQETTALPNTSLWKKIGDVKALPLPMACTLTQFMAGYKYYFAVRAVDVRSRVGPFSLPGSILLLNKV